MGSLFSKPKAPHVDDVPPPVPAATPVDPAVLAAHTSSQTAAAKAAAGASNINTSSQGLGDTGLSLVKKQLLGQ